MASCSTTAKKDSDNVQSIPVTVLPSSPPPPNKPPTPNHIPNSRNTTTPTPPPPLPPQQQQQHNNTEKDSATPEEATPLHSLLLPPTPLTPLHKFSSSHSQTALDGWVKQPSPCCAASATAGAWNAAMGLGRHHPRALSYPTVLAVLEGVARERVGASAGRLVRSLGLAGGEGEDAENALLLDPLLEAVRERLAGGGRSLGGEGGFGVERGEIGGLVGGVVAEWCGGPRGCPEVFLRLAELYDREARCASHDSGSSISNIGNEENAGINTDNRDNHKDETDANADTATPSEKPKHDQPPPSPWKKQLEDWFHNIGGIEKLTSPLPSTAAFGNYGVMTALRRINDHHRPSHVDFDDDETVQVRLFMGKKRSCPRSNNAGDTNTDANADDDDASTLPSYVGLSHSDDESTVAHQWASLRSAFLRKHSALLFHLKNHYALIFALREWEEIPDDDGNRDGNDDDCGGYSCGNVNVPTSTSPLLSWNRRGRIVRRQMLTARRGQRPTTWIDFDEARNTMIGLARYKIMIVAKQSSS